MHAVMKEFLFPYISFFLQWLARPELGLLYVSTEALLLEDRCGVGRTTDTAPTQDRPELQETLQ